MGTTVSDKNSLRSPAEPLRPTLDIEALIDGGRWSARQKWSAVLGGLAMLVDGFDNQLLGIAIPAIARDWNVPAAAFAPALSIGLAGVLLGNAFGGAVGDRFGRKRALVGSIVLFGTITLLIAAMSSLTALFACRFIAGLGLGAAVPNASALVAEATPRRRRTAAVTFATLGSPLGGVVAGLVASVVLSEGSWQWLFIGGGLAPLLLAVISAVFLIESPQFLAAKPDRATQLRQALGKMGFAIPPDAEISVTQRQATKGAYSLIFAREWRRDTGLLWVTSFANMMALYLLLSWLPATLTDAGYSIRQASLSSSGFGIGGITGSLVAAGVIQRLGSRRTLAAMALMAAALGSIIASLALGPDVPAPLLIGLLFLLGLVGGAFNVVLFPLALHIYPASIRAFAFGLSLSVGRVGAVLSPLLAVAMVGSYASHGLFAAYAVLMLAAAAVVASISRHIPSQLDEAKDGVAA